VKSTILVNTSKQSKMNYYTIPVRIMESIKYYAQEDVLANNISYQEYDLLKTLDVTHIHTNEKNVIDKFVSIFQSALQDLEGESFDEEAGLEDRDNLYEIIEALNMRKKAIQDITLDVLKRREECCCY
jgi:hypothetical protein